MEGRSPRLRSPEDKLTIPPARPAPRQCRPPDAYHRYHYDRRQHRAVSLLYHASDLGL